MSHNPCHHDCSDFPDPDVTDLGCCSAMPIRRDCEAPTIPNPDCDEADPIVSFDPDTEEFTVLSILYDENCSPISDSAASELTTIIS